MGLYSMVFSSLCESFPSGQALGNGWMKFKIVVTGDMIEESDYNNSLFISNPTTDL